MAASDHVSIYFESRLHLTGRPQMSKRAHRDFERAQGWRLGYAGSMASAMPASTAKFGGTEV